MAEGPLGNQANPLALLMSAVLMLRHIDQPRPAAKIEQAIQQLLKTRRSLTGDLGGVATTSKVADRLIQLL